MIGQLTDPDPTIRRLALQALITLRGFRDAALARSVLARRGDEDETVREWAGTMAGKFPVATRKGQADPALMDVVDDLAGSPLPKARVAALTVLGSWGPVPGSDRSGILRRGLDDGSGSVRAAAFEALEAFPGLREEDDIQSKIAGAMADPDVAARIAAVKLALDHRGLVSDPFAPQGPGGRDARPPRGLAGGDREVEGVCLRPSPDRRRDRGFARRRPRRPRTGDAGDPGASGSGEQPGRGGVAARADGVGQRPTEGDRVGPVEVAGALQRFGRGGRRARSALLP